MAVACWEHFLECVVRNKPGFVDHDEGASQHRVEGGFPSASEFESVVHLKSLPPPQGHHAGEDRVRQATGHGVPADVPLIDVLAHALVRVRGFLSCGDERVQQEF